MKKRCTNSKCRKIFTVKSGKVSCPFCNKSYPRVLEKTVEDNDGVVPKRKSSNNPNWVGKHGIAIWGYAPMSWNTKLKFIRVLQTWMGMRIVDAKVLADNLECGPVFLEASEILERHGGSKELTYVEALRHLNVSDDTIMQHLVKDLKKERFTCKLYTKKKGAC